MSPDIVIVGAGPAGLCLARTLSGHGLSIVVLERQAEQVLAEPAFDGREIALTHGSQALLERLGLWSRLPAEDIAVLRDAQVFNGPSLFALKIRAEQAGAERLGHLVANQAIFNAQGVKGATLGEIAAQVAVLSQSTTLLSVKGPAKAGRLWPPMK